MRKKVVIIKNKDLFVRSLFYFIVQNLVSYHFNQLFFKLTFSQDSKSEVIG